VLSGRTVEVAFDAVYAANFASLVRLAAVTTGSVAAAEDIVQDVFVGCYRHFDEITNPAAWLRRAVVSRCTSWVRRAQRERRYLADLTPEIIAPLGSDAVAVRTAMANLGHRQRAAVFLRYYLDLPEAEIAEALGCRPGTVKSLLHRALAVLRREFDD
jgi:RNA polymerase sigma-70 factor (sigma-E family)